MSFDRNIGLLMAQSAAMGRLKGHPQELMQPLSRWADMRYCSIPHSGKFWTEVAQDIHISYILPYQRKRSIAPVVCYVAKSVPIKSPAVGSAVGLGSDGSTILLG